MTRINIDHATHSKAATRAVFSLTKYSKQTKNKSFGSSGGVLITSFPPRFFFYEV